MANPQKNPLNLKPVEIHYGGQSRELIVTPESYRLAHGYLKQDPRMALALDGSEPVVLALLTFALHHELGTKIDLKKTERWHAAEPKKLLAMKDSVTEAYRRYFVATGVIEDEEESKSGEGGAPSP
jgi:hypothetical protein